MSNEGEGKFRQSASKNPSNLLLWKTFLISSDERQARGWTEQQKEKEGEESENSFEETRNSELIDSEKACSMINGVNFNCSNASLSRLHLLVRWIDPKNVNDYLCYISCVDTIK